jgi:hypothetical protein
VYVFFIPLSGIRESVIASLACAADDARQDVRMLSNRRQDRDAGPSRPYHANRAGLYGAFAVSRWLVEGECLRHLAGLGRGCVVTDVIGLRCPALPATFVLFPASAQMPLCPPLGRSCACACTYMSCRAASRGLQRSLQKPHSLTALTPLHPAAAAGWFLVYIFSYQSAIV